MRTIGPFRALDHVFLIEAEDAGLLANLGAVYAPLAASASRGTTYRISRDHQWIDVHADSGRIAHVDDLRVAEEHLIWTINRRAVDSWPGVLLHGGVVRSPGGSGIVILGRSGAGKSSLVTALVQLGHGYLSDELVPFQPDGTVIAHPRAIALKPGSWSMLDPSAGTLLERRSGGGQLHVDPRELGVEIPASAAVRLVVLLDGPPIPAAASVGRPRLAQGIVAMLDHAFRVERLGGEGLTTLLSVATHSVVVTLRGGSVQERVELVQSLV